MNPLSAFFEVCSLTIGAWDTYSKYNGQQIEREQLLIAIEGVNKTLYKIADDIIEEVRSVVASQDIYVELTNLIGELQGYKNVFNTWPVTGPTMNPSQDLLDNIRNCQLLEGKITSWIDSSKDNPEYPFRYPCCLYGLYSNTMAFLFAMMDQHSLSFGSNFRDQKNYKELYNYSDIFLKNINNKIVQTYYPITGPWVKATETDIPSGNLKKPFKRMLSVYCNYNLGTLDVDYKITDFKIIQVGEYLELNTQPALIEKTKSKIMKNVTDKWNRDLTNACMEDPLIQLSIRNGEIGISSGRLHKTKLKYATKIRY